jgi:NADH-ubiquinone oxidoreductase chain 4
VALVVLLGEVVKEGMAPWLFLVGAGGLLMFSSGGLILLYFRFELSMLPVLILLLLWGRQPERVGAMYYFLIYGVLGVFPLVGVLGGSLSSKCLGVVRMGSTWVRGALVVGFLVKFPLYGLHLWLPKAHVEAPTLGRVVLAGLLLKLGR